MAPRAAGPDATAAPAVDLLARAMQRLPRQLKQRALQADRKLAGLWRQLVPDGAPALLLATGGYGRQQLYPASDVDVAIVHAGDIDDFARLRVEAFAAAAWSLQLDLALTTRSLAELAADLDEQQELFTTLLFARPLAGDLGLRQPLRELQARSPWTPLHFLAAKLAEQRQRHARFADTAYNLEPHLKDGPGGLRDVQVVRWTYAAASGALELAPLVRRGVLEAQEVEQLEQSERLLGALRSALHEVAGRREERLLFDHQVTLAARFGFADQGFGRRGVEALMQRFYRCAGTVRRLNQLLLDRLQQQLQPQPGSSRIDAEWRVQGPALEHADPASLAADPLRLLAGLRLLAQRPELAGFGAATARVLPVAVAGYTEAMLLPAAQQLVELLRQPQGAARLLRLCADCGLLGRLLPAWDTVRGRMQFDLFHTYTVDEHTLRLLARLEALALEPDDADFKLPRVVWMRVRRPELLFLAGLFHDIAKGRGGDHSELGAAEAQAWLAGIGMDAEAVQIVAWLVAEHLRMSVTAQKKDISDPAVVAAFAAEVQDPERLNLLFLLTVADIQATNPKLWNGWKARLIGDLYEQARYQLRRGAASRVPDAERIAASRNAAMELLRGQGAGWHAVEAVWRDFPPETFLRLKADELRWITQAILESERRAPVAERRAAEPPPAVASSTAATGLRPPLVAARRSAGHEGYQVFVRAPDQPGLFATITSVLDASQLSVLGARIASGLSGLSLDTFEALDLTGAADPVARAIEIQLKLVLALQQQPLKPKLVRRMTPRQQRHFRIPLLLELDPQPVNGRSQVALVCADRPGLLARVALAFHELGLRVHAARIATFGERVEDFFELSDGADQPLDTATFAALRAAIERQLEAPG